MEFIVEIANIDDERAFKEYDARSVNSLIKLVAFELARYPTFRFVCARRKGEDKPFYLA